MLDCNGISARKTGERIFSVYAYIELRRYLRANIRRLADRILRLACDDVGVCRYLCACAVTMFFYADIVIGKAEQP